MTALGDFGRQAATAGVTAEHVRLGHYALCASIDDAVLHTPWGASSKWSNRPLTVAFHQDAGYGTHFFDALERLSLEATKNAAVIETFYLCLSLGFGGKYRDAPAGRDELDRLRAKTCALILKQKQMDIREAKDLALSPRWHGVQAPYRPAGTGLPIWVVHAAALAVCGAMFLWVSTALNAASDDHFARALAAPPARMPAIQRTDPAQPPPAPEISPSETGNLERIRDALRPDIASGWVTIAGSPATPLIRVHASNGFTSGGATPSPLLVSTMERIGAALREEPGAVQVIAYTDNQAIKTVRFASNFALSDARARAARDALARTIGDPNRLSTEGRAGADPIASNATEQGREQNRRIEIVLHRPE
jgi:type VI secretion system protein ImpK